MARLIRYSTLYIFPFLIMLGAGYALQLLTQKIEPGFYRTAIYAALSLLVALGISRIVRNSQTALKMKPFFWGAPSSLLWGILIGLTISAVAGTGFGISQGYPLQWDKLFNGLPLNVFRQASPALIEEVVFRAGIVHSTYLLFGKAASLASGSVPFGILHLAGLLFGQSVTTSQIFGIGLAGLMLSLMYLRFGILGAFATHLTWNALVSGWINVYGVTNKAAVVSALEGSWITCLLLALACTLLYISLPTEEADIDISQLERNLKLTPERRLIEHQAALELCEELARAGQRLHEQSQ